jgi:hypothetical protein
MTARAAMAWWTVALVLVAAAILTSSLGRSPVIRDLPDGEPAFPALRAAPASVDRIIIGSGEDRLTLVAMAEGGWTLAERGGFSVDGAAVRALVAGLVDMRLLEAKTTRPDRYHRLGLAPPDTPQTDADPAAGDGTGIQVRLETADGRALADVTLGDHVSRLGGFSEDGTYIRRAGEARTWLASGRLDASRQAVDWLRREIVDLPAETLLSLAVTPAEGPAYRLWRPDTQSDFSLEPPPPEDVALDPEAVSRVTAALAGLRLEEVAAFDPVAVASPETAAAAGDGSAGDGSAGDEATADDAAAVRSRIEAVTREDVVVTATLVDREGGAWLRLAAAPAPGSGEEAEAAAAALDARWQGWQYRVPAWAADRLSLPRDALLPGAGG